MPTLANGNGSANRSTKFQLPALDFKFGSLTEGTNIPPPLPSPIEEEPPEHPRSTQLPADSTARPTSTTNGTQTTPEALRNGLKRSADAAVPGSPSSSKGPASIRRLFSRNRLNEALHANGDPTLVESMVPRPISQSNASIATDRQSKRSSGWFRRLRGSDGLDSRRSSRMFVSSENTKPSATVLRSNGPPPPMIPEFKALGSKVDLSDDAGSLGADLFKNIN